MSVFKAANDSAHYILEVVNASDGGDLLDCPEYDAKDLSKIDFFSFWIEGVMNCIIAGCGLIANAVSAYILSR